MAGLRNTGAAAERVVTKKSMTGGFQNFIGENRENILSKLKRETGNDKVTQRSIKAYAKELWTSMSEQERLVYTM
jgi:hypothetical protein|tara:strand:- start:662 stop:886 length:225 start_codon:yes stop_codon:yes gene_type:complete